MKGKKNKPLEQRLSETDPGLGRIAVQQSGCRCGVESCEFAADFAHNPADSILKEIGGLNEEQKDRYAEQLTAPLDPNIQEEAIENAAGFSDKAEFGQEFSDKAEFGQEFSDAESDPEYADGFSEGGDAEFGDELTGYDIYPVPVLPGFGNTMEAGSDNAAQAFDPKEDNGEDVYHSMADYRMIDPDSEAFNAQGS